MKRIIKLRQHHYLQLDSYKRQRKNLLLNIATILFITCLSIVTITSALGIDITNPNPNSNANTR